MRSPNSGSQQNGSDNGDGGNSQPGSQASSPSHSDDSDDDDFVDDSDSTRRRRRCRRRRGHHDDADDSDHDDDTRGRLNDLRSLQQLTQYMADNDFLGGDVSHVPDESDWILTGIGVVLYFLGWASILTLFVVIVVF